MRIPLLFVRAGSLSALLLGCPLLAQDGAAFGSPQPFPAIGGPVLAVDVDGDGDLDVLTQQYLSGSNARYGWVENLGSGNFGPDREIGVSTPSANPTVIDFDADGDLDLALNAGGLVYWYERTGSFTFAASQLALTVPNSFASITADLDGDGDADIAAADFVSDVIVTYENTAGGFVGPTVAATTGYLPTQLDSGDYDQDGDVDLAWTSDTSQGDDTDVLELRINSGDGTFTFGALYLGGPSGAEYSPTLVDMDGDGDLDVHTSFELGQGLWYENRGNSFVARMTSGIVSSQIVMLDVDRDGDLDTVHTSSTTVGLLRWNKMIVGPSVQMQQRTGEIDGSSERFILGVGLDVDDDGDLDLIGTESPSGRVVLIENRLRGDLGTYLCDPAVPNSTGQPAAIAAEGSLFLPHFDMTLRATQIPTNTTSIFLVSPLPSFVAGPGGSQGNLCLGGAVGRYVGPGQVQNSGVGGAIELAINLSAIPTPNGFVSAAPGETWYFQAWHRDANPSATSNFTSAVAIQPGV